MWAIVFAVIAIVCGIGWLCYWLSSASLVMFMIAKGYTLPTEVELKACMKEVIKKKCNFKN